MTKDLQKKLKSRWDSFTASEQKIASHLLNNISGIPFETAASLGKRVGVSAMTVGRFLRNLGYAGLGELKEELRGDAPWLKLYKVPLPASDADFVSENLQAEIRGLTDVHELARTEEWRTIVRMLIDADKVSIASFQHGRFLGLGFASLLEHVRPRVTFDSGADGAYTELLLDSTPQSCVVLIDVRRYSRHFRLLADEVAARGIPLVIITDTQCYWARQLTPNVLMVPLRAERAWHSLGTFTALFSLLISAMTREMGDVLGRIGEITALRQKFVGYVGPSLAARVDTKPPVGPKPATRRRKKSDPL
ncbi:MurR/RpiR family transcriptional regulator [Rhodanobacter caeni]|uniref:MurR/RpiR family transcriptional regulator n=1 Tax=Rhodanobacter caeni TaxID=657654 RepID=A0ABP3ECS8_9GAMM